ncbi:MAG: hypothetical protein ABIK99_04895 [candidate division WOR-3 bacterium]
MGRYFNNQPPHHLTQEKIFCIMNIHPALLPAFKGLYPKNLLHQKLAEISKRCHQLKAEGKEEEIEELEKKNDDLVKRLFGIKGS